MTRRLEAMDRIRELGDSSVPFPFDVQAPVLIRQRRDPGERAENAFAARRLKHANPRRALFFATEEVRDVLAEKLGNLLEYAAKPEAEQYYRSLSSWPTGVRGEPAR
jgi:hypothetical protein